MADNLGDEAIRDLLTRADRMKETRYAIGKLISGEIGTFKTAERMQVAAGIFTLQLTAHSFARAFKVPAGITSFLHDYARFTAEEIDKKYGDDIRTMVEMGATEDAIFDAVRKLQKMRRT